jgi:hypothetical protein
MCLCIVAAGADGRLLFSDHAVRGFAEFGVHTSRAGPDLGRCAPSAGQARDPAAPCAAFSRYAIGGYFEIQPLGRKLGPLPLERLFFFMEPTAFFGRNLPPWHYSASMEPIMWERVIGLGVELPKNFEFRLLRHQNYWLGRYEQHLGDADLGPNGPYGLYAALSLRWSYGGWGRWVAPGRVRAPRHLVRGFAEFELNPSHAEREVGRCASYAGIFGGADALCSAFARYGASGYLELQPLGRKLGPLPAHRLFLLAEPKLFFGRNVPQFRYSASMEPILLEWSAGLGVKLTESLELRFRQHRNQWLGRHRGYLGPADLGGGGPYGRYAALSLRWYFGGWNRRP